MAEKPTYEELEYQLKVLEKEAVWRKQAEEALRQAHDELERKVKERTRELEIERNNLSEVNTALEVLLNKREEDKIGLENDILLNVREMILPYIEKIKKTDLDEQQETFLSIIETNLSEIISPFIRGLSMKFLDLTPTEIQIVNLIIIGKSSKQIAEILRKSPRTVDTHRKNIREKIGLKKKRANLRSRLLSM